MKEQRCIGSFRITAYAPQSVQNQFNPLETAERQKRSKENGSYY